MQTCDTSRRLAKKELGNFPPRLACSDPQVIVADASEDGKCPGLESFRELRQMNVRMLYRRRLRARETRRGNQRVTLGNEKRNPKVSHAFWLVRKPLGFPKPWVIRSVSWALLEVGALAAKSARIPRIPQDFLDP